MKDNLIAVSDGAMTPVSEASATTGFDATTGMTNFPCRQLFETIKDGMLVLDGETGQIVDANAAFLELTGTKRSALIGFRLNEASLFSQSAIGKLTVTELTEDTGVHLFDVPLANEKASPLWIDFTGIPCEIAGFTAILCNFRDLTEYRKARERISDEEAQFRSLVEQEIAGIYIVNLDGTVAYINPRFAEMLGYSTSEILAQSFTDNVVDDDKPALLEAFGELVAGERTSVQMTSRVRHKDGSVVDLISQGSIASYHGKRVVVGVAMDITERKRSEKTCARLNRALRTLNAANAALIHAESEEKLLESMCEIVVSAGGYRLAWIGHARNDEFKTIEPLSIFGDNRGYVGEVPISWDGTIEAGQGPTGSAIRTGEVQVFQNLKDGEQAVRWRLRAKARDFGSCISLPLKDRGHTFGALTIYAPEPDAFSAEEMNLLTELGAELSYGVSALRDRFANIENTHRVQESLEDTVEALAAAAGHRDPYTAGHQRRVASLAVAIGRELGLSDFSLRGLRLAATIHDIGKICVPAEILSRSGKISPEEYAVIKRHADVGYEIIKGIAFPWSIAEMVWQHHERLDGLGYPRRLKGDEILLEARILAVADVVEAIMAHRPYRPAMGINPALAEIELRRGTAYDERVVDACLSLFKDKGFVFE